MTVLLFGYLILGPSTRILIFLNPQIFLSGYGFRPHAFGSESGHLIFKSALQSGKKNPQLTNPITCGQVNSDIFESHDVANSCPVSYRRINQYGGTSATTGQICRHYRALCDLCSDHILLQRSPGYYGESRYHRVRVNRRIRFEYATCGRRNF